MTESSVAVLLATAISIGFVHTLIGVDHSLPFVVLGRARGWTLRKVLAITAACGLAHVASSVAIGFLGISVGVALEKLEIIEGMRGSLASWLIVGFGLTWATWAFIRGRRGRRHSHGHVHEDGSVHKHGHEHAREHMHAHEQTVDGRKLGLMAFWSLFLIFAFGPCEALIPMLMFPAMEHAWGVVALVTAAFGLTTIGTMMAVVGAAYVGLGQLSFERFERHADVFAGLAIAASGAAIPLLGL
jgi:nickel/cobalt transporter (NicO) family protein